MSWKNIALLTVVLGVISVYTPCCPLEKYLHRRVSVTLTK